MIKVEIVTTHSRYVFDLPANWYGDGQENVADAYEWLDQQIHPSGFIELPGRIIDINPEDVKGVDVWQEEDLPEMFSTLTGAAQEPPTEPWEFTRPVQYLGRKIVLEALAYEQAGRLFILPLALDGRQPFDAVSEHGLRKLVTENFTSKAEAVIPPPVTLTATEAVAFLIDYAEAAAPDLQIPDEVNARAAGGVLK